MKRIKIFLGLFMILILRSISSNLSAQTWQWSHQIGSNWWDFSGNIVTDSNGNSYSAGIFQGGYCYFPGDTSNIVNGNSDFYLVKFNSAGNLVWWRQIGGSNSTNCSEGVASVTIDGNDNIYFTGSFCGQAIFGSSTQFSQGNEDGFIAKYDVSGNCMWSNKVGSYENDDMSGITVDDGGYVYVCGTNNDTANISGFIVPPGGFIAKYDTTGNCIWAKKKISSTLWFGTNYCAAIPTSIKFSNGFFTVAGFMGHDTVTFDTTSIYSKFGYSYLAQFDTSGTLKWVKTFGGPQIDGVNFEHAMDGFGNSYVTGTCYGTGYFQTDTLSGSVWRAFIVKIDSTGTEQWVRGISSSVGSWGNMVSSDGDGNVYVTGKFRGNTSFGSYNVTAATFNDMFIARYNSSGDCLGVRFFGEAEGFGVTQDNSGNAYVCGNFSNTITIGNDTYTSYGDKDIFIAKLDELVGIGDARQAHNQLVIYANPTAGKCNITIPDALKNEKDLWLTIFDNTGRQISSQKITDSEGKIIINLEQEAKGIYNVSLGNSKVTYYGKIVFE